MDRDVMIMFCKCNSFDHQLVGWYDKQEDELYLEIHLSSGGFFKRLWKAIKYVVGYKSIWGDWDEFIMDSKNIDRLYKRLKERDAWKSVRKKHDK